METNRVLTALKGESSFGMLKQDDVKALPSKLLRNLGEEQVQELSKEAVGALFDSDLLSLDTASFKRTVHKLTEDQFIEGLDVITEKMTQHANEGMPWRPPLSLQNSINNEFFRRMSKHSAGQKLQMFTDYMCPYVSGLPLHQFRKLPPHKDHVEGMLNCFEMSYEDLSDPLRNNFVKWVHSADKEVNITRFGKFILDVPSHLMIDLFRDQPQIVKDFVMSGKFLELDPLNKKFKSFQQTVIKTLLKYDQTSFDSIKFLDMLGMALCEIPFNRVKDSMGKTAVMHLTKYLLNKCEGKEELLSKSLDMCTSDAASRLARYKTYESKRTVQKASTRVKKKEAYRPDVNQFKLMRDLADSLFEEKDLKSISSTEMEEVAGALSGLKPKQLEELPKQAVLESFTTINKNKNMSPQQKKIVLKKAKEAGLKVKSLSEVGELVTELKPEDFEDIPPENLLSGISELREKSASFDKLQKKAIAKKMEKADINMVLEKNLGDFAQEISLEKLEEIDEESINMTVLKDQKWDRGQAAKLIEIYRNGSDDVITNEQLHVMGSTITGLKCSDVWGMYNDEMLSNAIVMSEVELYPDMEKCIRDKLHSALEDTRGQDYMKNDTDGDLREVLESIPPNILLHYPAEMLDELPEDLCQVAVQKIGQAQFSKLSPEVSKMMREKLASKALRCMEKVHGSSDLNETVVSDLGQLVCDLPHQNVSTMTEAGFNDALPYLSQCITEFDGSYRNEVVDLSKQYFGNETSEWDSAVVDTLGPVITLLNTSDIDKINGDVFMDSLRTIQPPESVSKEEKNQINYDGFYGKAVSEVVRQATATNSESSLRRRKRDITTLTYDVISVLGAANSAWTPEQLATMDFDDLVNSLQVLGSVSQWTEPQASAILTVLGSNLTTDYSSWSEDIVVQLRYILQHANEDLLSELPITSQVASSFSDVDFSNLQKSAIYQNFLSHNNVTVGELTSEQLVALGPLLCGSTSDDLELVLPEQISNAMKDLGQFSCFNQTHYDILYSAIKKSRGNESIDSAVLSTFGLIAAGMSVEDWSALPVDSMSFVDSKVFSVVDPTRIRDGLANEQIVASGILNAGAMYENKELYGVLSVEQQYAVLDTFGLERPEESEVSIELEDTIEESPVAEVTTEESPVAEETTEGNSTTSDSTETPTTDAPDVRVVEETTALVVNETTTSSVNETTAPDISKVVNAIKESGFSNIVPSAIINTMLICLVAAYNM